MAEAGFLVRRDAEHRTILDRGATRRVAGRTPRITNSPGANLSQLAMRVEPEGPSTRMCELNLLTPTNYFLIYQVLKSDTGHSIAKSGTATTGSTRPKSDMGCRPHNGPANAASAPPFGSSSSNYVAIGTCQGITVRIDLFFFSLFNFRFSFGVR